MTAKHKRGMTLDEHHALLKAEGRYDEMVQREQERENARQAVQRELRLAEKPLRDDLQVAGFSVTSVWDLVNTASPYPAAIPILLTHLQHAYPVQIREGIARALAVKEAKSGWSILLGRFRDERERRAKDGLAVALAVIADDEHIGDLLALIRDGQHGPSRAFFLKKIAKSRDPRAQAVLSECRRDPDLAQVHGQIMARRSRNTRRRAKTQ